QRRQQVGARDAVHHAVVDLGDDREAVVLESLDDPHLPQRPVSVEMLRLDAPDDALELSLAARARQPGVAHVVAELEARIVDPHGMALERGPGEALPVARDPVQARGDVRLDAFEVDAAGVVAQRGSLEHGGRADVHRRARVLVDPELAVELGEALVVSLGVASGASARSASNSASTASTRSWRSGTASQSAEKPQNSRPS